MTRWMHVLLDALWGVHHIHTTELSFFEIPKKRSSVVKMVSFAHMVSLVSFWSARGSWGRKIYESSFSKKRT